MNLPSIEIDGNSARVDMGGVTVWFSYRTPIAFSYQGQRVVRVNDWSNTTGKHLTAIDGGGKEAKAARVTGAEFEAALLAVLGD